MKKPFVQPREAALLVIDMQKGFCHPDSQMGRNVGVSAQQAIIPNIQKLVNVCRDRRMPILWSRQEHFPEDVTRARKRIPSHADRQKFLPCLRNTWETEFDDVLKAGMSDMDHVVFKHRASVFYNTNLETKLRMLGTQVLLIAGCNTEFCVASTVRDAYARDFDLVVLSDCVAGIRPDFHEESLKLFQAYFAEVLPLSELESLFC